jgi:hypothetical protein
MRRPYKKNAATKRMEEDGGAEPSVNTTFGRSTMQEMILELWSREVHGVFKRN